MNAAAHIDRLLRLFPSTRRVNLPPGGEGLQAVLELVFEANDGLQTLRVYLPAEFPVAPPAMQVVGGLTHPWLDSFGRVVGCPTLVAWSPATSLLEGVVQDVLVGLQIGMTPTDLSPPPSYEETILSSAGSLGPSAVPLQSYSQVQCAFLSSGMLTANRAVSCPPSPR